MIKPQDVVNVNVDLRVVEVVHKKDDKHSLLWGYTSDGVYVCVPLSCVTEKFAEMKDA